ncbi:hypothetical protein HY492_03435 [Candidatus Woesearchaeota archaeon]|nr:hypothetical protein [Candidatus Woesearchaeota archaeon]
MAFVRVKTIKGNRYAYLVENTWQTRGSRQTVKGYLGKVITPDAQPFGQPPDISALSYADAVTTLASWTLANHGFAHDQGVHSKEAVSVHLANRQVLHKTKSAVLELNEGFLCSHTLSQLLEFVGEGSREEEVGQRLANTLLEAGIAVPQETFVALFHKIYKPLPEAP